MTESQEAPKTRKGLSIASLVCGIIGGYASTISIPAIICGHIALGKIKREPAIYGAKKIAIAGLILGYLGLVLSMVHGAMHGALRAQLQNLPRALIEQNSNSGDSAVLSKGIAIAPKPEVESSSPVLVESKFEDLLGLKTLATLMDKDVKGEVVQEWLSKVKNKPDVDGALFEAISGDKNSFFYNFFSDGIRLTITRGTIAGINLYAEGSGNFRQYQGALPLGLSFALSRREVESILGYPEQFKSCKDLPPAVSYYKKMKISVYYDSDDLDTRTRTIGIDRGFRLP